jgi:hypothetical protein
MCHDRHLVQRRLPIEQHYISILHVTLHYVSYLQITHQQLPAAVAGGCYNTVAEVHDCERANLQLVTLE